MMLIISFLVFRFPSFTVLCPSFKVGIGAHRGPDGARVSRWPMGTENPGPNPASSSWLLLYVFIYSRCELGTGKRRNEQQLAKTKTDNACASSEQRVTASIHAGKKTETQQMAQAVDVVPIFQ